MRLTFVRHGRTLMNLEGRYISRTDAALDSHGVQEAIRLSETLERNEFDALFTSPSQRTIKTAELLAKKLSLRIEVDDRLRELDFGPFEGCSPAELEQSLPPISEWYRQWRNFNDPVLPPGAEPYEAVAMRARNFLNDVCLRTNCPIIVSHGVFIRILVVTNVLQLTPDRYRVLRLDNACATEIEISGNSLRLLTLNVSNGDQKY